MKPQLSLNLACPPLLSLPHSNKWLSQGVAGSCCEWGSEISRRLESGVREARSRGTELIDPSWGVVQEKWQGVG